MDIMQLKALAEKVTAGEWWKIGDLRFEDRKTGELHGLHHDDEQYISAVSPADVLDLIAKLKNAQELLKGVHTGDLFGPEGWETVNDYLNQHGLYGLGGRCDSCDGTGDLVDITGEWRGYCCCAVGVELRNRKAEPPANRG